MNRKGVRGLGALMMTALLLGGCAAPMTQRAAPDEAQIKAETRKQQEIALRAQLDAQARLSRVAWPLLRAAAPMCGEAVRPMIGVYFTNRHTYTKDFRETASEYLGVGKAPQATFLVPGSPAARAGMKERDVLLSIDGEAAPEGRRSVSELTDLFKEKLKSGEPVVLGVRRGKQEKQFTVRPEESCDSQPLLADKDVINAFADGDNILVTRGMLRFVENDNELGFVIAHELAHNAMKHIDAQRRNFWLGSIVDIVAIANGIYSPGLFASAAARVHAGEFEAEADYVALYIMARAGEPIDQAPTFWRRVAAEHPKSIEGSILSTHPTTPERFMAMEKSIQEIHAKQAAGLPLDPEYKPGAAAEP